MQLSSPKVRCRGRHGVGYPAWGMPNYASSEIQDILHRLEAMLVDRIRQWTEDRKKITQNNIAVYYCVRTGQLRLERYSCKGSKPGV